MQITEFFVNFKILRTSKGVDFQNNDYDLFSLSYCCTISDSGLICQG